MRVRCVGGGARERLGVGQGRLGMRVARAVHEAGDDHGEHGEIGTQRDDGLVDGDAIEEHGGIISK